LFHPSFVKRNIDLFIANRKVEDILLVYPFEVDKKKIEAAAPDLNELSYKETTPDDHETIQNSTNTRSPAIAIRVETYNLLEDGQWLNDSLVDFGCSGSHVTLMNLQMFISLPRIFIRH
jgi:Ulp1 family protease